MNKHELQAEINARKILLRDSFGDALAHIENVLRSILQSLEPSTLSTFREKMAEIENITPAVKEVVQLFGEVAADGLNICGDIDKNTGAIVKSKRQIWLEELAQLEEELANAPEAEDCLTEM